MYEELAKNLRDYAAVRKGEIAELTNDAADAIEKLQGTLFLMKKTAEFVAEKVPKWIPVTERLPRVEEDVFVAVLTSIRGKRIRTVTMDYINTAGEWDEASCDWRHEVTHWMPLPEPPKEDNDV